MHMVTIDGPLRPQDIADIAHSLSQPALSDNALRRLNDANAALRGLVDGSRAAYGLNTGVGGLSDVRIAPENQALLSRKIVLSHATGLGPPLRRNQVRAIIAAAINLYSLGHSGLRAEIVERLVAMLVHDRLPGVPRHGSVGYLTHMAHIALPLIGFGTLDGAGAQTPAAEAFEQMGFGPLELQAKEGLCLVNGLSCATGIGALMAIDAGVCLDWADRIAAASFDVMGGQAQAFAAETTALRAGRGFAQVSAGLRAALASSARIAAHAGRRTQDALSLRAIPHIHGAARDALDAATRAVRDELRSVSDNPAIVAGEAPRALSEAHAVGASMALAMDQAALALAMIGTMSERRLDRFVNPLTSPFAPFLASDSGTGSGFMIAQYSAMSLVAENRRLAMPATLDGGITSGLQEDILVHATPAALKADDVLCNTRQILAIELLAICQAIDLAGIAGDLAPPTQRLHAALRQIVPVYEDDRPLACDMTRVAAWLRSTPVPVNPD